MRLWCYSLLCIGIAFGNEFPQSVTSAIETSQTHITTSSTTTKVQTSRATAALVTSNLTCSARTVNYITDILPQQCLRTDWTRTRASHNQTSTGSQDGVATAIERSYNATRSSYATSSVSHSSHQHQSNVLVNSTSTLHDDESTRSAAVATTALPESAAFIEVTSEPDNDPLLDESSFLSFEDWKQQNLAKAGQSAEHIGSKHVESGRRAPDLNDLDTLGDENEIEIDFSGFGGVAQPLQKLATDATSSSRSTDSSTTGGESQASQALRPRDAGKTCKERTNYASFDCAATILKSNPECKSASSVLIENKDSYMLNRCSAKDKHFIVELCNDILVDTVVLANFEFFSSIFRHFKVSVSDRYPAKNEGWKDLGTFEARNTREVQAFLIENPLIWARYLKIEFVTHYGSEYYCPISLLRVHGTTMMEEFRNQEESARGDNLEEVAEAVAKISATESHTSLLHDLVDMSKSALEGSASSGSNKSPTTSETLSSAPASTPTDDIVKNFITISPVNRFLDFRPNTCPAKGTSESSTSFSSPAPLVEVTSAVVVATATESRSKKTSPAPDTPTSSISVTTTTPPRDIISSSISVNSSHSVSNKTVSDVTAKSNLSNATATNNTFKESALTSSPTTNTTKSQIPSSTAPQPQPSTQESFFKSISKRLQQLESNSTLSMQYIEQSSRILREAFNKVEKRQIGSTATFLSNLNNTVMAELAGFRQAYDQLWQSTVIELEGQREQHHREMTDLSSRLTLVVDELVWQKRMGIIQSTLLLLCLALVIFARNGNSAVEIPFMHQVMSRSQAAFRSNPGSDQNSPSSGRSPVSLFRRKIWKSDGDSASSRPGTSESAMKTGLLTPRSLDEQDLPAITYTTHDDLSGSGSEAEYAE